MLPQRSNDRIWVRVYLLRRPSFPCRICPTSRTVVVSAAQAFPKSTWATRRPRSLVSTSSPFPLPSVRPRSTSTLPTVICGKKKQPQTALKHRTLSDHGVFDFFFFFTYTSTRIFFPIHTFRVFFYSRVRLCFFISFSKTSIVRERFN